LTLRRAGGSRWSARPAGSASGFCVYNDPGAATPQLWREYVSWTTSQTAPGRMTEGAPVTFADYDSGHDPADPVDRAIMATRKAVIPHHGLLP
jgi:acetoin utilization protein AcuC